MNHPAQEIEQITEALLAEFQPDHWFFDHIRELIKVDILLNKRFTRHRQNEVDTLVNQTKEELRDNTELELDNELDQAIGFLKIQKRPFLGAFLDGWLVHASNFPRTNEREMALVNIGASPRITASVTQRRLYHLYE